MTTAHGPDQQNRGITRRRLVLFALALPAYFLLSMFLPAGKWTWTRGWLFIAVFIGIVSLAVWCLWRVNPDVVVARSSSHEGTKHWDKILLNFFFTAVYAIVPVVALDDGRFHWHPLPWWLCGVGYCLLVAGMGIVTWAQAVNKFFEPTVRIQTDRGQTVIDSGPYAVVRHPGYVGGFFTFTGVALALGSLWALIPAAVACFLLALRTHWEDQTLQAELTGYKEYAKRIRYRLISGVW